MARSKKIIVERLNDEWPLRRTSGPLWQPAVDVYRCPQGWKVKFDLAGVSPDDIQIFIADDHLIVRGVRRDSVITEGWSYHQLEITYSRFERVLKMPCDLSNVEVHSESKDGWFIIHIDTNSQS